MFTYMRKYVVATSKVLRVRVLRIYKVLKTVLPQTHVFEAAIRLLVRLNPIGRAEGHDHHKEAGVSHDRTEDDSVYKQSR